MSNKKVRDWSKVEFPEDEVIDVISAGNDKMSSEVSEASGAEVRDVPAGPVKAAEPQESPAPRRKAKKKEPVKQSSKDRIVISSDVRAMIEQAWLRCLNEGRPMSRIEIIDLVFEKGFRKAFPDR